MSSKLAFSKKNKLFTTNNIQFLNQKEFVEYKWHEGLKISSDAVKVIKSGRLEQAGQIGRAYV